jgi:soluble lytic murein transglycosylase-like protein
MARLNRAQLIALVEAAADQYGIDRRIAIAQIQQESGFAESVVYGPRKSSAGAMGIAQFIPGTAARFGLRNPYDPAESMQAWGKYMSQLLRLFNGRYDLALAAYNWGEARETLRSALRTGKQFLSFPPSEPVKVGNKRVQPPGTVPTQTHDYVKKILSNAGKPIGAVGAIPAPPSPTPPAQKKT